MFKPKLRGFTIACIMAFICISPGQALAAETSTESATLSEGNTQNQKDKIAAFEEAMKIATEKWNALTDTQRAEVYDLIEEEMKAEMKLIDKFVEFQILSKEDASAYKANMMSKFNQLKESGRFPLSRQKRSK